MVPAHTCGCTEGGGGDVDTCRETEDASTFNENGWRADTSSNYLILLLFLLETKQVKELENGNSVGGGVGGSSGGSPAQEFVPINRYEIGEEVRCHAVRDHQADLALHPAKRHFEKPRKVLWSRNEPEHQGGNCFKSPPSPPGWRHRPHQLPSFQSFFVAVEADPGAEDDGAHKVDVAHELDGRRHAGDDASVQIEGQRDGFHGDYHL